ncbi:MAG TPA: biotin/lipoyl-binding protein [Gemmataceae bacterium]|nr:biotin/lipoyl-binding protein [Gemmataceae bacterium]
MRLPRRSFLIFVGVVLLLASVGGGTLALRPDLGALLWARPSGPDEPAEEGEAPVAVCLGRVDAPSLVRSLHPLQPGRVKKVRVKEGDEVKRGDVLLELDDAMAQLLVRQAEEDVAAAEAQLQLLSKMAEQQRLKEEQQEAVLRAGRERIKQAEELVRRKKELRKAGLPEAEVKIAEAQLREARDLLAVEEKKLEELRLNRPPRGEKHPDLRRAEADLKAKKARLGQAAIGVLEHKLTAPVNGVVLRLLVREGSVITGQPQQPAVLLAPREQLIVRAEVDQEVAGRVRPGQRAVIRDDANNKFEWEGRVDRLSDWYAQRRSILLEPGQLNDIRTLEAVITIPDQESAGSGRPPLRIGQRVRVAIFPD